MPPLRLEVFETAATGGDGTIVTDAGALEEARLAAFEQGYTAGWDDASAALGDDQTRIRADLARSIQALSFTFHDARSHVLRAVEPLLTDALCKLLPDIAHASLAPRIIALLAPLAAELAGAPVRLILNPAVRLLVEALLEQAAGFPLEIIEEPSLGEGQVYLRLGDTELRLDLDGAVADIRTAITDFFTLIKDEARHGQPR
jgi:hypothetical protein